MLIAGSVDLAGTLARLARVRPVFHSERDFQLAFAWQIQLADQSLRVRLETRPAPSVHLDLEVGDPHSRRSTAIELKYLTRSWSGVVGDEPFSLTDHSARDIRGYDVIKDIVRIEAFTAARPGSDGAVIAITNDAGYWVKSRHGRVTNADAFRLAEGMMIGGRHHWRNPDGGTAAQRPEPLDVTGRYEARWADYSRVGESAGGTFRQLVIEIVSGDEH